MKDEEDWISRIPNEDDLYGESTGLSERLRGLWPDRSAKRDDSDDGTVPVPDAQEGGPEAKCLTVCFGDEVPLLVREKLLLADGDGCDRN